jgi:competence protein ComEA
MQQPPPFILPQGGWRARARGLLAGIGIQGRALALIALAALVLAVIVWVRGTSSAEPPLWTPPDGTTGAGVGSSSGDGVGGPAAFAAQPGGAGPPQSAITGNQIAIHVGGRVRRPGLVSLPAGSRVADALAAAGGPLDGADLDRVNLARRLTDGEQVLVVRKGDPMPPAASAGPGALPGEPGASSAPPTKVDLNTATVEQLESLPGVGAVTAGRIVAHRTRSPFRSVRDLLQVEGIGERRYESLRDLVTVG